MLPYPLDCLAGIACGCIFWSLLSSWRDYVEWTSPGAVYHPSASRSRGTSAVVTAGMALQQTDSFRVNCYSFCPTVCSVLSKARAVSDMRCWGGQTRRGGGRDEKRRWAEQSDFLKQKSISGTHCTLDYWLIGSANCVGSVGDKPLFAYLLVNTSLLVLLPHGLLQSCASLVVTLLLARTLASVDHATITLSPSPSTPQSLEDLQPLGSLGRQNVLRRR